MFWEQFQRHWFFQEILFFEERLLIQTSVFVLRVLESLIGVSEFELVWGQFLQLEMLHVYLLIRVRHLFASLKFLDKFLLQFRGLREVRMHSLVSSRPSGFESGFSAETRRNLSFISLQLQKLLEELEFLFFPGCKLEFLQNHLFKPPEVLSVFSGKTLLRPTVRFSSVWGKKWRLASPRLFEEGFSLPSLNYKRLIEEARSELN